jgi:hypothetical protein
MNSLIMLKTDQELTQEMQIKLAGPERRRGFCCLGRSRAGGIWTELSFLGRIQVAETSQVLDP